MPRLFCGRSGQVEGGVVRQAEAELQARAAFGSSPGERCLLDAVKAEFLQDVLLLADAHLDERVLRVGPEVESVVFGVETVFLCGKGRATVVFVDEGDLGIGLVVAIDGEQQAFLFVIKAVSDDGGVFFGTVLDAVGTHLPRRGEDLLQGFLDVLCAVLLDMAGDKDGHAVVIGDEGSFKRRGEVF